MALDHQAHTGTVLTAQQIGSTACS